MKEQFNVGDIITWVSRTISPVFTRGKSYEVVGIRSVGISKYPIVIRDNGSREWASSDNFKKGPNLLGEITRINNMGLSMVRTDHFPGCIFKIKKYEVLLSESDLTTNNNSFIVKTFLKEHEFCVAVHLDNSYVVSSTSITQLPDSIHTTPLTVTCDAVISKEEVKIGEYVIPIEKIKELLAIHSTL